jgi:DNA polymerase-3 subunit gamma/tau
LHLAPDPRSGTEMTLLRMLAFRPGESGGAIESGPKRATASISSSVAELRPPPLRSTSMRRGSSAGKSIEESRSASTPVALTVWSEPEWSTLIASLNISGAVKLLASNCAYLRREGNTIFLGLDARSESMLTRARQNAIAEALSAHFAEALNIDMTLQTEQQSTAVVTPLQEIERHRGAKLDAARKSLDADPNVHALRDIFGAELNEESVEVVDKNAIENRE